MENKKDYFGIFNSWDRFNEELLFRYVKSADKADEICEKIYDGRISTEEEFFRATKSIRPFVAHIYGWKMYGRQK